MNRIIAYTMVAVVSATTVMAATTTLSAAPAALAHVESGNKSKAVGDGGKAIGKHQFHRDAWNETSDYRRARKQSVWPYKYAVDPIISDSYAASRVAQLYEMLRKETGRPPTLKEIYAAYNVGMTKFKSRGYKLENCPPKTRRQAERFSNLTIAAKK